MQSIEVNTPLIVGEMKVASIRVKPLKFTQFAAIAAMITADTSDTTIPALLRRGRFTTQCTFIGTDGKEAPLTALDVMKLPIPLSKELIKAMESSDGEPGKVLSAPEADGVEKPIRYQLGTPIKAADGKEIVEIEFQARIYGDLEDVMGETNTTDQTILLLSKVAKPEGMLQMPSWALGEISAGDGTYIAKEILPRFL